MKLKLTQDKDIQILSATENISVHDAQVLKSGINNLLKKGKNQILVDLSSLPKADLPPDVLVLLAHLDLVARELSGRVVLGGVSSELRTKIEHHAKPPVILCFESREKAIAFLREPDGPPKPALPELSPEELLKKRESVRQRELQELGPIRKQLALAEEENQYLRGQLESLLKERRKPVDSKPYEEKIKALETELNRLIEEMRQKPQSK